MKSVSVDAFCIDATSKNLVGFFISTCPVEDDGGVKTDLRYLMSVLLVLPGSAFSKSFPWNNGPIFYGSHLRTYRNIWDLSFTFPKLSFSFSFCSFLFVTVWFHFQFRGVIVLR